MIPDYTRDGLLPAGEHESSWAEFVERYEGTADNGRRRKLMLGLAQMLVLLERAGGRIVWVDGSFVTRERWPRDFDLCYGREGVQGALLDPVLLDMSNGRRAQKTRFGGEAMPADFPIDWSGQTVRDAFAWDRDSRTAKGLIRLQIGPMRDEIEDYIVQRQQERAAAQASGDVS